MAGIDDVLERLITDPAFKANLAADPRAALAGYQLSANDLSLLAQQVSSDDGGQSAVEQRTSKAGFFALFSQFSGGPGGPGGGGSEVSIQDVSERPAASDVSDPDLRGVSDPDQRGIGGPDTMPGADRGIIINGLEQSGPSGAGSEVSIQDVSEGPRGFGGEGSEVSVQDVSERPGASDVSDPDLRGVSDPDQRGIGGPDTMPGADRGIIINGLEQSGPSGAGSEVSVQDVSERPGPGGTAEVSVQDVSERPAEFGGGQG